MRDPLDATARAELQRGRAADPTVKVVGLAAVRFAKPDLAAAARFGADFGLLPAAQTATALYLRGHDGAHHCYVAERAPAPRFLGLSFTAAEAADLARLAALPGASPVTEIAEPGGGRRVRLATPGGVTIDVIHGQAHVPPTPLRPPLAINSAAATPRLNAAQRAPRGPAQVVRLGHAVLQTRHHARTLSWCLRHLGLIVSDYQALPDAPASGPVIAFLRCDLGATPADHHTLALAAGFAEAFEHAAFEVQDLDALALGGEHLRAGGWRRAWGIGRHILGSQLFDYWRDGDGVMLEHYADGDRFDASVPTATTPFGPTSLAQWGPPLPADFLGAAPTPRTALQLAGALLGDSDFTLRKLVAMGRALARRAP